MEKNNNISLNLKELCIEFGINLKRLAKEIGISDSLLYKYASSTTIPTVKNAIKIANYFNCSLNYLFGLSELDNQPNINNSFNTTTFYNQYDKLLKENNTSHYALCKNLNLTSSSLTHWKNGEIPYIDTLIKLATFFDVSIDYLIGRTTEK